LILGNGCGSLIGRSFISYELASELGDDSYRLSDLSVYSSSSSCADLSLELTLLGLQ
jgi:hypothetical protein